MPACFELLGELTGVDKSVLLGGFSRGGTGGESSCGSQKQTRERSSVSVIYLLMGVRASKRYADGEGKPDARNWARSEARQE